MKGLRNPLLLIPGLALLLLLATVVLADRVLIANFVRLEREDVEAKTTQILRALDAELGTLTAYNRDYAQWDEPFRFVMQGGRHFPDVSMQTGVLQTIETDLVLVVAANREDLFSALVIGEGPDARRISPAPEAMLAPMRAWHGRLDALAAMPAHRRLFRVDGQIYAFAGARITDSDRAIRTDATLFFARRVDATALGHVRRNAVLPIEMLQVDQLAGLGTEPQLAQWLADPQADHVMLPTARRDRMAGIVLLRDVAGEPVALLRTEVERDILFTGRRNTWLLVGAIAALLTVFVAGSMLLILRLRRSNRAQEEEQERYRRVIENLEECVALADAHTGRIVECNAALQRALGLTEAELRGRPIEEIFIDFPRLLASWQRNDQGGSASVESRLRAGDGRMIDTDVTVAQLYHSGRRLLCLVARDITLRKQAEREREDHRRSLEHQATHDTLTGLPNRLYLKAHLPELLRQAATTQSGLGLLFLDLDQFKAINDTRGHAAGDELLRVTAQRLRGCVATGDTVIRMGGDEFVVLVRDLRDRQAAAAVAQRVVDTLREPLQIEGRPFTVSASVGISLFPEDGFDMESLLKHADIALYEAKGAGRDNFKFFEADMNVGRSERVAMQQALRHAIGTSQIHLEYQPIFRLATGQLSSFEALVRWRHPEFGVVPAARFIALAEQSGLIHPLGDQIIDLVFRQLAAWRARGLTLRPITVNISPLQLERANLTQTIRRMAAHYNVDLQLLHLEVTETAVMQEGGRHVASLQTLRELGCKILIDDFGIGYSSLAQLKNLPLDRIKIDRSFVRDMASDTNDAAIVTAVVSMAHSLGLDVVAEGIESAEQLAMLQKLGCEYGQGFHFEHPLAPSECIVMLEAAVRAGSPSDSLKIRQLRSISPPRQY